MLALDTVDHRLSHRGVLAVEADDKAGGDEHAVAVDLLDALRDVAPGVLLLLHLHERLGIRALDADENPKKFASFIMPATARRRPRG